MSEEFLQKFNSRYNQYKHIQAKEMLMVRFTLEWMLFCSCLHDPRWPAVIFTFIKCSVVCYELIVTPIFVLFSVEFQHYIIASRSLRKVWYLCSLSKFVAYKIYDHLNEWVNVNVTKAVTYCLQKNCFIAATPFVANICDSMTFSTSWILN